MNRGIIKLLGKLVPDIHPEILALIVIKTDNLILRRCIYDLLCSVKLVLIKIRLGGHTTIDMIIKDNHSGFLGNGGAVQVLYVLFVSHSVNNIAGPLVSEVVLRYVGTCPPVDTRSVLILLPVVAFPTTGHRKQISIGFYAAGIIRIIVFFDSASGNNTACKNGGSKCTRENGAKNSLSHS